MATPTRTPTGFVFYFDYKAYAGAETTDEVIHLDLGEPATLVIQETMRNVYFVSIIAKGEKMEWTVDEIINLKFGFDL